MSRRELAAGSAYRLVAITDEIEAVLERAATTLEHLPREALPLLERWELEDTARECRDVLHSIDEVLDEGGC